MSDKETYLGFMDSEAEESLHSAPIGTRIPVTMDGVKMLFEVTGHENNETQLRQVAE